MQNDLRSLAAPTAQTLETLAFTLGQEGGGIDIQKVQALRGDDAVTGIANVPEHINGVGNLRRSTVPIIDMRIKFKLGTLDESRLILVDLEKLMSGDEVGLLHKLAA
jgi:purine-binding chemotaxis protein CheW